MRTKEVSLRLKPFGYDGTKRVSHRCQHILDESHHLTELISTFKKWIVGEVEVGERNLWTKSYSHVCIGKCFAL